MPEPGIGTTTSLSVTCSFTATEQKLNRIIEKWRRQRKTLQLSMRQTLLGSEANSPEENSSEANSSEANSPEAEPAQRLQHLCTELIDYVSTGHFSVYNQALSVAANKPSEIATLLQGIYQYIGSTTDLVLQFNDRIEAVGNISPADSLHKDLLKLHKSLSVRFALEEQLLELGYSDQ